MTDRDPGFRREPDRPDADSGGVFEQAGPAGPAGPADLADPAGPAGQAADEEMLRRLLKETVETIEPSAEALVHLRRAVPARRRRRRQLLAGAVASVALLGIGAPLAVQSASTLGGTDGDARARAEEGGVSAASGGPSGAGDAHGSGPGGGDATGDRGGGGTASEDGATADGGPEPDPTSTDVLEVTSPDCARDQLGDVETVTEEPDADGTIYGAIRLVNVSGHSCRVDGHGDLSVLPFGPADRSDVQIVDRTEGDRATRLPTPEESHQELVLPPGEAYEVRFAWVPDGTHASCAVADPSTGEPGGGGGDADGAGGDTGTGTGGGNANGGPHAPDDPVSGGTAEGGTGEPATGGGETPADTGGGSTPDDDTSTPPNDTPTDASGAPGSPGEAGGTPAPDADATPGAGVTLQYTPSAGEPEAAEIVLRGACSGTIYRTGVLEAPAA